MKLIKIVHMLHLCIKLLVSFTVYLFWVKIFCSFSLVLYSWHRIRLRQARIYVWKILLDVLRIRPIDLYFDWGLFFSNENWEPQKPHRIELERYVSELRNMEGSWRPALLVSWSGIVTNLQVHLRSLLTGKCNCNCYAISLKSILFLLTCEV